MIPETLYCWDEYLTRTATLACRQKDSFFSWSLQNWKCYEANSSWMLQKLF